MTHARPHLETHVRSKGHSAVGGAAYRLGLRLHDDVADRWHDYKRRKDGGEVVAAFTLAPEFAAPWAKEPAQLWNAVERAEKRKDAQVARDYRCPIPFGLSDVVGEALAREMAQHIMGVLQVPVSVGLHRDASVDALGAEKPESKQGIHAHLYFPTRILLADGSGFGAKLSVLSNKHTSGAFVESLNARWAELANFYTAENGLVADYDHRSYERAGIHRTPQVTLGATAVAMERKGHASRRGDYVRAAMSSEITFREVSMAALERRRAGPGKATLQPVSVGASQNALPETVFARLTPKLRPNSVVGRRLVVDQNLSLAQCLRRSGPKPASLAEKEAMERSMMLADNLESCLATFEKNRIEEARFLEKLANAKAAMLTADYDADVFRGHRFKAERKLIAWERRHPWQTRLSTVARTPGHREHKHLALLVVEADQRVQAKKVEAKMQMENADKAKTRALEHEREAVKAELRAKSTLNKALAAMPDFLTHVRAGLSNQHRALLGVSTSTPGGSRDAAQTGDSGSESLVLAPPAAAPQGMRR